MKDEIKEILSYMQQYVEEGNEPDYNGEYPQPWEITIEEVQYILDYITNLQEENNSLKQMSKDTYDTSQEIIFELQERIDKAIEYIMTELITEWDIENGSCVSGSDLPVYAITPLLNILQGE